MISTSVCPLATQTGIFEVGVFFIIGFSMLWIGARNNNAIASVLGAIVMLICSLAVAQCFFIFGIIATLCVLVYSAYAVNEAYTGNRIIK